MHDELQRTEHDSCLETYESRAFPHGRAQILKLGDAAVGRCGAPHVQRPLCERLAIRMDDGTESVSGRGDITALPRGRDAGAVSYEPVVVDWFRAGDSEERR